MKKITQKQMASKIGISAGALSYVLSGEDFGTVVARRIGEYIGVDWKCVFAMDKDQIRAAIYRTTEKKVA